MDHCPIKTVWNVPKLQKHTSLKVVLKTSIKVLQNKNLFSRMAANQFHKHCPFRKSPRPFVELLNFDCYYGHFFLTVCIVLFSIDYNLSHEQFIKLLTYTLNISFHFCNIITSIFIFITYKNTFNIAF